MAKGINTDYRNSPVAWFTMMEISADRGRFEQAAKARQELEHLGVFIQFKGAIRERYEQPALALSIGGHSGS